MVDSIRDHQLMDIELSEPVSLSEITDKIGYNV